MTDADLNAALHDLATWLLTPRREQEQEPKQEPPQPSSQIQTRHHTRTLADNNGCQRRASKLKRINISRTDEGDDWEVCWDLDYFPRFLELPREIRDMVYGFAMDKMPTRFAVTNHALSKEVVAPGTLPSFCFASKQLQQEGMAAWIRRTRFVVPHRPDKVKPLLHFLEAVKGLKEVRMLRFLDVYYPETEVSGDGLLLGIGAIPRTLAASCTGLRSLILEMDAQALIWKGHPNPISSLRPKKQLLQSLGLGMLIRLKSLKHCKIKIMYWPFQELMLLSKDHINKDSLSKYLACVVETELKERHGSHPKIDCELVLLDYALL